MDISLTSFIDFVLKSGSPKMTCAKQIKNQIAEVYDPIKDYYKRFRDAIQELHKHRRPKNDISEIIGELPSSKLENYKKMEAGYKKFMGNKKISWFPPERENWFHGNLNIPINPEVGLEWNGEKYLVKLYLKSAKPS
ncbi:hypothetical protein [Fulvivirga sediminis]|uniref:Uncharacterized protein n=1 Tax=Fulvivirga sediminis TaxID=2803949 RepID=A0A937FA25_9BACT|nr:hypothetical protein [Fulvivirga sediminis]MBL3657389.1 hypothetical protein [Fulvivirga sediminis]